MNIFRKYAKTCMVAALVLAGLVGMTALHVPGFAPRVAQAQDQTSGTAGGDQTEALKRELASLRAIIRNLHERLIEDPDNKSLKQLLSSAMSDYAKVISQMSQGCTSALEAEIYMMLDRTGSMSGTDLSNERNAAKGLLGFFDDASPAPLVGVGSFGGFGGSQAATVHGLTNSETPLPYGDDDEASDGDLYAAINQATGSNSSVGTNIGAALIAGQGTLASGILPRDILIIVSDGDPSNPDDVDESGSGNDVYLDINGNGRIDNGDDLTVNFAGNSDNDFIVVNGLLQISNSTQRLNALDVTENGSLSNSDDYNFGPGFNFAIIDGRLHVAADSDGSINDQLIDRDGSVNAAVYARYWATRAKSAGTEIFAIAFGATSTGQNLLRQIATDNDHAYVSPSSSDLESIFLQIAEEICDNDDTPPEIECPADIVVDVKDNCSETVEFEVKIKDDDPNTKVSCVPPSGSSFPVGVTTITCTATDSSENSSSCSFTVTVLDEVPPSITCPANIVRSADAGACSAIAEFTVTGEDNCGSVTITSNPPSGSSFPVGVTTVTATATDASGNTATCSFTVTVNDTESPSITCPANLTVNADKGQCAATVNYTLPSASDNCEGLGTVVCNPAPGLSFSVGTTTVTCIVTDSSGNSSNCSFTVTVNDTQPPAITCPANISVNATEGQCAATVNYTTPTSTDSCAGSVSVSCLPASGSSFSVGATTVTCTATDATGNTANCSFTVTVNDGTPPSITCPANISVNATAGQCAATVNYTTPTGTDNCAGNAAVVCVPAAGSSFPVGTTTVTCTADDGAGNKANCSFTVTVTDDTPPSITCPANIVTSTTAGQCAAVVNFPTTASDTCSTSVALDCAPPAGSSFPLGTTTVNCTATDASGNTANCSFTVTVSDNTPPTIVCPNNIVTTTAPGQCSTVVNYSISATDNCGGPVAVISNPPSGSTFPKGVTTVTAIATDQNGNTATCSFTITVNDMEPPEIICSPILVIGATPPGQSCATIEYPLPTATDNCPGVTVTCTPAPGSCFPVGTTTVNCVATDASGNTTSAESCDTPIVVEVFDCCLQDDSRPGRIVLFNSRTGDYMFCCDGMTLSGRGLLRKKGGEITITHTTSDRSVLIKVSKTAFKGVATARTFSSQFQCEVEDRDTRNNTCICGSTGNVISRQN